MKDLLTTYALPFAAWELRLFLDTHPNDQTALQLYRQACIQGGCSDPCTAQDTWTWLDDPWPWEAAANETTGRCDHVDL